MERAWRYVDLVDLRYNINCGLFLINKSIRHLYAEYVWYTLYLYTHVMCHLLIIFAAKKITWWHLQTDKG